MERFFTDYMKFSDTITKGESAYERYTPIPELLELEKKLEEKLKGEMQGIAVWEEKPGDALGDLFKTQSYKRFSIE